MKPLKRDAFLKFLLDDKGIYVPDSDIAQYAANSEGRKQKTELEDRLYLERINRTATVKI